MPSFLALYRGRTIGEAQLVAVSTDPLVVTAFASRLLQAQADDNLPVDPVLLSLKQGQRQALRLVEAEVNTENNAPDEGRP